MLNEECKMTKFWNTVDKLNIANTFSLFDTENNMG